MKKINTHKIIVGQKKVKVDLYKINKNDNLNNLSRVYVIASDKNKKIPLIYNSKRKIWGFPGGHIEKGESYLNTALRECIEEIKKTIKKCQEKFLLINKIDSKKKEKQIICFAKISEECENFIDENESVNKIIYTPIDKIISKIKNKNLWEPILNQFKEWDC
jgi:ADP-ribose pyrophosphatase YjhB (NUDIX family)